MIDTPFITIMDQRLIFLRQRNAFSWMGSHQPAKAMTDGWNGVWFTCEFAQRLRAPDDGCKMFDDEGFQVKDGLFTYLRVKGSEETAAVATKRAML